MRKNTDSTGPQNNASIQKQIENCEAATIINHHTMKVGDTTIRLSFNGRDSISTQLANAFSAMLQ